MDAEEQHTMTLLPHMLTCSELIARLPSCGGGVRP